MFARGWPGTGTVTRTVEDAIRWPFALRSSRGGLTYRRTNDLRNMEPKEVFGESTGSTVLQIFTTIGDRGDYRCLWFSRDRREPRSGSMIAIIFRAGDFQ